MTRSQLTRCCFIIFVVSQFLLGFQNSARLSRTDRTNILRECLTLALTEKQLPDFHFFDKVEFIPISSNNINSDSLPNIPGFKFMLLDSTQLRVRADSLGDFSFIEFHKIVQMPDNSVDITLNHSWALNQKTRRQRVIIMSGGFIDIHCYKSLGIWTGEVTRSAIY